MAIADLSNVLNVFRGGKMSESERDGLFKEVLLMTLARATSSDANIDPCEVETVQDILKEETGDEFSAADIRLASRPALYEEAPFNKYLGSVRKNLTPEHRSRIVHSLARVIKSDTTVRQLEVDFFNMVADSLQATAADAAGLIAH